ncbi:uncharacterized protein LOC121284578 isoform X2 [Carcharodon carcharias]|uniref:uncharacterized protein LOC121284578 isoform X2 n=1 Tax=Carcharodon carcharias TaxID=13397 RepID=UPI001B7E5B91|nr:uncharacterized protein LOC121284578 isoform X2 [Carcharodon carcharias]
MASRLFEEREHAALYQKYRVPLPSQICNLVLNYLQRKKGKPFSLAVDIGCGSGQSTRGLAAYFEKVIGIDASGAQIEEARKVGGPGNISFRCSKPSHPTRVRKVRLLGMNIKKYLMLSCSLTKRELIIFHSSNMHQSRGSKASLSLYLTTKRFRKRIRNLLKPQLKEWSKIFCRLWEWLPVKLCWKLSGLLSAYSQANPSEAYRHRVMVSPSPIATKLSPFP